jgi:hypothetical protein
LDPVAVEGCGGVGLLISAGDRARHADRVPTRSRSPGRCQKTGGRPRSDHHGSAAF